MRSSRIKTLSLILASAVGIGAFAYPFFAKPTGDVGAAGGGSAPAVFLVLMPALLVLIFGGLLKDGGSKEIALLGALAAINVTLRFIPLPLGGSAIFFLLLLAGYSWGAGFGFALGSLTILVSAFWAGGFGPWVPFQMVATGWVGMSGALFRPIKKNPVLFLALAGLTWGFLFGAIMNLWFWPYLGQASAGAGSLKQYGVFYLATSAFWDTGRAVVNMFLVLLLGGPILRVFERFKKRFSVEYV